MNIFYYSVHHILEHDEVSMLKALGHNVFRLGTRNRTSSSASWREEIPNSPAEEQIYDIYERLGGRYSESSTDDELLPQTFFDHFSAIVIMHSAEFIAQHWSRFQGRPVIWRTIGQAVDAYEEFLRPYRNQGLRIVRYSYSELAIPNSLGQDAIIRFGKDPEEHAGWTGNGDKVLTFSNTFEQRYPREAADYRSLGEEIPLALGGASNETFQEAIGVVTPAEQMRTYRQAPAYLYCTGLEIPYTLNFMEAWMIGVPLVVYAPRNRLGRYYEVDRLVQDGENGFVCRDIPTMKERLLSLLDDKDLARSLSAAGRQEAIRFFGIKTISLQWSNLLERITRKS